MGLAVSVTGQASKRGPLRRARSADRVAEEIGGWLHDQAADVLRSTRLGLATPGSPALLADLHPAAENVRLIIAEDGAVSVHAPTAVVGPGYHTYLTRLLVRLGDEVGIDWNPPAAAEKGAEDPLHEDRPAVERRHLVWLHRTLRAIKHARDRGSAGVQVCRVDGDRFAFEGALASALGPRDDAWLAAAIADPRIAIDVWPWWQDATDARYLLDRALCLMWTRVRWRVPATDGEVTVVDEVLRLLGKAYPLDPSLAYPWREWCELIRLGGPAHRASSLIIDRAAAVSGPLVGYRRRPVTVVHGGWALEVPGSFAERWADGEWWGGESGRSVTLAAIETANGARALSAEAFLARVAADLGTDALTHCDGDVVGKARLGVDPSSGIEVGVLDGYSAVAGTGVAIRVVIDDPADWEWALRIWRSLAPASA